MSTKPRVLVTTAAGKTGSAVAFQLLEKGYPVTAFVRRNDHRSIALSKAGAKIFVGDSNEPEDLKIAMQGVKRAYFCAPWQPNQLHGAVNFALAAEDAKLEVVVALTQWLSQPEHPSMATRESYMTNRVLDWMPNVDTVTINTGFFADNYMAVIGPIAQLGVFPLPLGQGMTAPVSNEDIARVAVGVLVNPAPHVGKYYRPTGPELLDPQQIVAIFSKVLGRPVKYQPFSESMFLKALKVMNMDPHFIAQARHYFAEYRLGAFAAGGPNDVVLEVGGSAPEDFETITRRYVETSPMAKRSLVNKGRALKDLIKILLIRAPDMAAYETSQNHAVLRAPKFSLDFTPWAKSHSVAGAFGTKSKFNKSHLVSRASESGSVQPSKSLATSTARSF